MYGWFEPGGGINKFFKNTQMIDVLLRSCSYSNNIVIGNGYGCCPSNALSPGPAAVYIRENNVGLKKIPDPSVSLDVAGQVRTDTGFSTTDANMTGPNTGWYATSSNMGYANSNYLVTSDGLTRTHVTISDMILQNKLILSNVTVINVEYNNQNSYDVTLAVQGSNQNVLENITNVDFISVNDVIYDIVAVETNQTFKIVPHFGDAQVFPLPFQPNAILPSVHVLHNFKGDSSVTTNPMLAWFVAESFIANLSSPYMLTIQAKFLSDLDASNVFVGQNYSLSTGDIAKNIVLLQSAIWSDPLSATLTLVTLDRSRAPIAALSKGFGCVASLILLDVLQPTKIVDTNCVIGSYTYPQSAGPAVLINGSTLNNYANGSVNKINTVNNIVVNGVNQLDIASIFLSSTNGSLIANLSQSSTDYSFTFMGTLSYTLIGLPFRLLSAPVPILGQVGVYRYFLEDLSVNGRFLLDMVDQGFAGKLILFSGLNIVATIKQINAVGQGSPSLDISTLIPSPIPSILYLVPFKAAVLTLLGEDRCYTKTSFAVCTKASTETLTVNGNASVTKGLVFRDIASINPTFSMIYDKDLLSMGDMMLISNSNNTIMMNGTTTINGDTVIHGSVTSDHYLSFSDRRLKTDIETSDIDRDLEIIRSIDLKRFYMKSEDLNTQSGNERNKKKKKRGVIAQELEAILPEAIHQSQKQYIPSICEIATVVNERNLVLPPGRYLTDEECDELIDTKTLLIRCRNQNHGDKERERERELMVHVISCSSTVIQIEERIVENQVFVVGPWDSYRLVDQEQLLMTMLGALKAIISKNF
jgi:hypothetical protein